MFIQRCTPICGPTSTVSEPGIPVSIEGEMERLMEEFFPFSADCCAEEEIASADAVPALNIVSGKDAFTLTFDMPGVKKEAVDVSLEGETLTVRGVTGPSKEDKEEKEVEYLCRERRATEFKRSVKVSANIDDDGISASLSDGVLTVTLPRGAEESARRIEVEAAK